MSMYTVTISFDKKLPVIIPHRGILFHKIVEIDKLNLDKCYIQFSKHGV